VRLRPKVTGASVAERSHYAGRRPRPPVTPSLPILPAASTLAPRPSSRLDEPELDRRDDPMQDETIVCGVDASEGAREVLRVAAELGGRLGARLVLVHVAPDTAIPGTSSVPGAADEFKLIDAERGHRLLDELSDAEQLEGPIDRRVAFGSPAPALKAVARQEGADLIVVGCRGRGAVTSALLGSVSSQLSRSASCPVVVVPPLNAPHRDTTASPRRAVGEAAPTRRPRLRSAGSAVEARRHGSPLPRLTRRRSSE
jgi:nucleotide-binding universal stress UspA family protein